MESVQEEVGAFSASASQEQIEEAFGNPSSDCRDIVAEETHLAGLQEEERQPMGRRL